MSISLYLKHLAGAVMGRGYDGAETRYGDRGFQYDRRSAYDEDRYLTPQSREALRLAIMDLRRNDPLVGALCNRVVDFSAGHVGLLHQAATNSDAVNIEYDQYFTAWAKRCDGLGRLNFGDFQRLLIDIDLHAGDCLLVRLSDGRLQGIEGEHIRQPTGKPTTANEYDGVRLNAIGQIVAFCVHKRDGNGNFRGMKEGEDYEWIPASDVMHWSDPWRFDMLRAAPQLSAGIISARDIKDANDSTMKQIRAQAKPALAAESYTGNVRATGRSEARAAQNVSNTRVTELADATFWNFLQGEGGLKMLSPATPNPNFKPFLEFNMRRFCAVTGFAYEFVMIDLTGGNFSRDRTAKAITQRAIDRKQARLTRLCNAVWAWQIARGIARKEIPPAPLVNGKSQFSDVQWIPPAQDWADDNDQADASMKRIQSGQSSWSMEAKRRQMDSEEIFRSKANDVAMLKRIAVEVSNKTGQEVTWEEIASVALPGAAPAQKAEVVP
jgi:lambda family phage portal protein